MKGTGLTPKAIGLRLGISTERVHRILGGELKRDRSLKIDIPLSTKDVAQLLNIHANTVRRWSRKGILKTYRVGPRGDRRFMRRDVQKLFQKSI